MTRHATITVLSAMGALAALGCRTHGTEGDGGAAVHLDAQVSKDGHVAKGDAGPPPPATLGPPERPADLVLPSAYDGVTPLPAVILLHGYGANAAGQDAYFMLSRATMREGFYLVLPNGTVDQTGKRFWNATPACCDFYGTGVDDVAYLTGLMDQLESVVPVAPGQLFFMGHSNGAFMSYRMACEAADRVAAIASLAGSDFEDPTACVPDRAVSVLEMHGDADAVVHYLGGFLTAAATSAYPGAPDVVARWAGRAGCDVSSPVTGTPIDLDSAILGPETTVERYTTGCQQGVGASLWTIHGAGHIPALNRDFSTTVLSWLSDHAR